MSLYRFLILSRPTNAPFCVTLLVERTTSCRVQQRKSCLILWISKTLKPNRSTSPEMRNWRRIARFGREIGLFGGWLGPWCRCTSQGSRESRYSSPGRSGLGSSSISWPHVSSVGFGELIGKWTYTGAEIERLLFPHNANWPVHHDLDCENASRYCTKSGNKFIQSFILYQETERSTRMESFS